jgi:hypothetical protein
MIQCKVVLLLVLLVLLSIAALRICPETDQEHDSFQTIQALQTALTVDGRDYILVTSKKNLREGRNVTMMLETEHRQNDNMVDNQKDNTAMLDKDNSDEAQVQEELKES